MVFSENLPATPTGLPLGRETEGRIGATWPTTGKVTKRDSTRRLPDAQMFRDGLIFRLGHFLALLSFLFVLAGNHERTKGMAVALLGVSVCHCLLGIML